MITQNFKYPLFHVLIAIVLGMVTYRNLQVAAMTPTAKMSSRCMTKRLEGIKEDNESVNWLPSATCPQPQTPTESMEFLARSWSLSAMELSKALTHGNIDTSNNLVQKSTMPYHSDSQVQVGSSKEQHTQPLLASISPPNSPGGSEARKQLYRNIMKGKTTSRWIKDQKERKKQESRTQTAQLHAAVSVAGVAAAVASLAALSVTSPDNEKKKNNNNSNYQERKSLKKSAALASAAALVASHCINIAEDMGADHDHILSVISSAINVRTNGDIMTLTAGAATALRGAATLRARMQNGYAAATVALAEEHNENKTETNILQAMDFVSVGGELLKRTRKGDLHWKLVSVNINSNGQVVAKLKSKHMAGTFTKKKKCIITGVYSDIPAWSGSWDKDEKDDEQKAYFGLQSADRIIEFECRNKADKQIWILGIEQMFHFRANMA